MLPHTHSPHSFRIRRIATRAGCPSALASLASSRSAGFVAPDIGPRRGPREEAVRVGLMVSPIVNRQYTMNEAAGRSLFFVVPVGIKAGMKDTPAIRPACPRGH